MFVHAMTSTTPTIAIRSPRNAAARPRRAYGIGEDVSALHDDDANDNSCMPAGGGLAGTGLSPANRSPIAAICADACGLVMPGFSLPPSISASGAAPLAA